VRAFVRLMDSLSTACAAVAALLLAASVAVITWMVVYRALGNSTYWEIEFAVFMMVAAMFLGSPYCLKSHGHVGVDLLSHYLPSGGRRFLGVVIGIVGCIVCAYLAYAGGVLTFESFVKGERTESTWAPYKWPLFMTMPVGMALTALQYLAEFVREESST